MERLPSNLLCSSLFSLRVCGSNFEESSFHLLGVFHVCKAVQRYCYISFEGELKTSFLGHSILFLIVLQTPPFPISNCLWTLTISPRKVTEVWMVYFLQTKNVGRGCVAWFFQHRKTFKAQSPQGPGSVSSSKALWIDLRIWIAWKLSSSLWEIVFLIVKVQKNF